MKMIPSGTELAAEAHAREVREEALSAPLELSELELEQSLHEPNWAATTGVGIIFLIIGACVIGLSVGIGIGFLFMGIIMIGGAIFSTKEGIDIDYEDSWVDQFEQMEAERDLEYTAQARRTARQQEVEEIIRAVKETIRVRCRYCGTLNEEKANKCESCGASL